MAGLVGAGAVTTHALDAEEAAVVEEDEAPAALAPRSRKAREPDRAAVAQAEAMSALGNLGYGPGEAVQAVAQAVEAHPGAGTPEIIRAALRLLAPRE
jgi:Holliday junction DNA helicase RuvA